MLLECESLLQQASFCASKLPSSYNERLTKEIAPLKKEIEYQLRQQELFYQAPGSSNSSTFQNTTNYHGDTASSSTTTERLIQSSDDLLRESQAILLETEQVGNHTLIQMGQQREQLQNTNANLEAVLRATSEARRILKSIGRRAFQSKLFLHVLIALLILANLWVLIKIYHKKDED